MTAFRRLLRHGAVLCAALLLVSGVVVGLHHHADLGVHDDCAVCAATHAPAQAVDALSVPVAPCIILERIRITCDQAPRPVADPTSASRAPPLA